MNDLERRLRDTLDEVASSTHISHHPETIVWRGLPDRRGWAWAVGVFAAVLLAFGIPAVFFAATDQGREPASLDIEQAVDPDWLRVDPDDIAVLEERRPQTGPGGEHPGPRPSLMAERVWCLYSEGPGSATWVSESVSLVEELTVDTLVEVCGRTDTNPEPASVSTVCRGAYTDRAYSEWLESGEVAVSEDSIGSSTPGFPVVLGWWSDCVSEDLATNPQIHITADLSVELINRVRNIEIAVTGAAYRRCLSWDQAGTLAAAAVSELGSGWMLGETPQSDPETGCYRPIIDLQFGAVYVVERRLFEEQESARTGQIELVAPVPTLEVEDE